MVLFLGQRHVPCQSDFVKPSWTETGEVLTVLIKVLQRSSRWLCTLQVRLPGFASLSPVPSQPPYLTVISDKLFNWPKSQCPHLENEDNDGIKTKWQL